VISRERVDFAGGGGFHGAMARLRLLVPRVSIAAFVAFLLASAWLGRLEQGGPPHADLVLEGRVPATLFLPETPYDDFTAFTEQPPPDARPPVIVLAHGFASDRVNMSGLARNIAVSGYAVLTLDLAGHGENRNPFAGGQGRPDAFASDLAAAVDYLRSSPLVDGSHIAVMGHSMGAQAALDFATRDSGLDAAIMISGGWSMFGPQRAANALFLVAAVDPPRIATRIGELAAELAGIAAVTPGETYGDFRQGTAVRRVEVPGADHLTILWSDFAAREILAWLDAAMPREHISEPPPRDPRGPVVALLAVLMVLVLPGFGLLVGRLTPTTEHLPPTRRASGLALLLGAFVATMPLASPGQPGAILSVEVGDIVVIHCALAGIVLLVTLHLRDRAQFASLFAMPGRSLLGAGIAMTGVYVLLQPLGTFVHRISLTPERVGVFVLATAGLLPFMLAANVLVRRGPPLSASLYAAGARVLFLLVMVAGVVAGVLPFVVILMLPALLGAFTLSEVLVASIYVASRNLLTIATIDAAWLALIVAAVMPVRI
jgi:dienelactone hydrolase